jgi:hypothetical protein
MTDEVKKFIKKVSTSRQIDENELTKLYMELWVEMEQKSQDHFFKEHIHYALEPYTRLKQDMSIHYGTLNKERYMIVFSFHLGMVQPKGSKEYYANVDDWEWVNPSIPRLLQHYLHLPTYHLVVVSDELISWKVQMIMNVVNTVLPAYGNASIYVNVNQRLPCSDYIPKETWSNSLMVGTTEVDQQFANQLGITDFFTPDMLTYP